MSVEIVTIKDYERIARENEFFFWHFTSPKLKSLNLQPYHSKFDYERRHFLKEFIDTVKIPYFESDVEDSVDFIINLDSSHAKSIYGPNKGVYNPVILSFHKRRYLYNTWEICYCVEGFVQLILKTNPKFLESLDLNN